MDIKELETMMKAAHIELEDELQADVTLEEQGLDSLDRMVIVFQVEKATGKKIKIELNQTVAMILEKINE